MEWCKILWRNPCTPIEPFSHLGLLPLGLRVLDTFLSFCRVEELGEGFGCVVFARLLISWRKLQLSPLENCPLAFHCQQSPRILCSRCFVPCFLTTGVLLIISISGAKNSYFVCISCSILLFAIVFNLSGESPYCTIPKRLEFLRLSYSQFAQSFQDVIRWDFRHWSWNSVPFRIEFLNIITSKNNSEWVA